MKTVEERLRELPDIAERCGVTADEALRLKIKRAAACRGEKRRSLRRMVPVLAFALVLTVGLAVGIPLLTGQKTGNEAMLSGQAAGRVISLDKGSKTALDVPQGSITITASQIPDYHSIWASANGANYPLINVGGRYYRLLTTPKNVSSSLLGDSLGTVDTFTDEPALAGGDGVISNVAAQGEAVYAVSGMNGAMVAANLEGKTRVFQRVGFGDSALVGGETLRDTLCANDVTSLELSGVGTVSDAQTAKEVLETLFANASYQRSGGGETDQSLLIHLSNGLTLQLAVSGEKLIGCGTWACPEFFEAFSAAAGTAQ